MSDPATFADAVTFEDEPVVVVRPRRDPQDQTRKQPRYHVVLLNDDDHTYDYVIDMLGRLFGHDVPTAFRMAREVDGTGRTIVLTTHRERAELKRDQIHGFGADVRLERCVGSMRATIEPAVE